MFVPMNAYRVIFHGVYGGTYTHHLKSMMIMAEDEKSAKTLALDYMRQCHGPKLDWVNTWVIELMYRYDAGPKVIDVLENENY